MLRGQPSTSCLILANLRDANSQMCPVETRGYSLHPASKQTGSTARGDSVYDGTDQVEQGPLVHRCSYPSYGMFTPRTAGLINYR